MVLAPFASRVPDRPKKLLFLSNVVPYFFPENAKQFGGVSRQYKVIRHFAQNPEYEVFCLMVPQMRIPEGRSQGVTFVRCRLGRPLGLLDLYRLGITFRVDLIVEFCASLQVVVLGLLHALHGQRFIFFVDNDTDVNGLYGKRSNRINERLYRLALSRAEAVICQTNDQRDMLQRTYGLEGEVVLSPYVEVTSPFEFEREYILWVGRAAVQKQPERFLRLARRMPDEQFVMIFNPGVANLYENIKQQAQLLSNVHFIDAVLPGGMKVQYAKAKCLINTSDFEGFPNTFLEAAVEGTPVVSFKVNPNRVFTTYKIGIVCNSSMDQLLENTRRLAKDRELRDQFGEAARAYVQKHHGIDAAMDKLEKVFFRVLH